jgi:mono/diheme cytochrome c family protein
MRLRGIGPALLTAAMACSGEPAREPEVTVSGADSVAMAAALYDPANFDSIQWETPAAALERGSVVFSYSCAKCHGPRGEGDGGWVSQGDTLRPPSFHGADWRFAEDPEGLKALVFTGAEGGMPHWGLEGLKYRDVDAVARFILEDLRKAP